MSTFLEVVMLPSLFISHGSPMLALEPGASGPALAKLAADIPRPNAIVVVSAHWESQRLLLTAGEHPQTWHDFGGFPASCMQCSIRPPAHRSWPSRSPSN